MEQAHDLEKPLEQAQDGKVENHLHLRLSEFARGYWSDCLVLIPFLYSVYWLGSRVVLLLFSEAYRSRYAGYYIHVVLAKQMLDTGRISIPHFLYQVIVIGTAEIYYGSSHSLSLDQLLWAGRGVSVAAYLAIFMILYLVFRRLIRRRGILYAFVAALTALTLMAVSAINIPGFIDRHRYFGYLPADTYNIPTQTLLKPFALLLFFIADSAFSLERRSWLATLWLTLAAAILSVLSTLAKPSFTVVLLPAVGLVAAYRLLRRQNINWPLLVLGIVVPSGIVLGWQYSVAYASQWSDLTRTQTMATRIELLPFATYTAWKVPLYSLAPKLLLSILFPLTVYVAYWKRAVRDLHLNLAWLILLFGLVLSYGFVEVYIRTNELSAAGNFTWSGLIAVFVLFVASLHFWVRQLLEELPVERAEWLRLAASGATLMLHIGFGVAWYLLQFNPSALRY